MANSLNYYKNQKISIQNKINQTRRKNQNISKEIERLRTAYNSVYALKHHDADDFKKYLKLSNCGSGLEWRADCKDKFDDYIKNEIKESADSFYKQIDKLLDAISTEIGRKQGEYDSGIGLINSLNKSLSWVTSVIRNWTN